MQESDARCSSDYKPLKNEESKDQKNSKTKKDYLPAANNNSKNKGQSAQALGQSSKNNFRSNRGD